MYIYVLLRRVQAAIVGEEAPNLSLVAFKPETRRDESHSLRFFAVSEMPWNSVSSI